MAQVGWSIRRPSSELQKNKLLLRTVHFSGRQYHPPEPINSYSVYHVLNPDTGEVSTLDHVLIDDGLYGYTVVVDSKIFVLGRVDPSGVLSGGDSILIHRSVSYLDLSKPKIGWIGAPDMSTQPLVGDCVSYGGKLYTFRGSCGCFDCEVFDPETNNWSRIKPPPLLSPSPKCEITRPVMADPSKERILVFFKDGVPKLSSTLFAYYPDEDKWESLVDDFRGWSDRQQFQVVFGDGIIYVHDDGKNGKLRAYDVTSKQWLKVTFSSSGFEFFLQRPYHSTHYMGNGLLCFVDFPVAGEADKSHTSIYVVQLKVELKNDPKEVLVTFISSKTYHPLDCRLCVCHCVPI